MNKDNICSVRGIFTGLYAWGDGWSKEVSDKWHNYWKNIDSTFWQAVEPRSNSDCVRLLTIGGSIYLHPMDFRAVLINSGGASPRGNNDELEDRFGLQLDELKRLCEGAAEACGGEFHMVAQAHTVENDNFRNW